MDLFTLRSVEHYMPAWIGVGLFIYFVRLVVYYVVLIKCNTNLIPERLAYMPLHVIAFIPKTCGHLWDVWPVESSVELGFL